MKKIICFVLTFIFLLSGISLAAGAGSKPRVEVSGIYEYIINKDKTVSFAGYHEKDSFDKKRMSLTTFSVPDKIDGHTVTGIYDYAFSYWRSLSDLTLPETITSIGEGAFNNCTSLTTLAIPASVKKIDKKAFAASRINNIIVVKGSYAEEFCKQNNLTYSYPDSENETNGDASETVTPAKVSTGNAGNNEAWYDYGVGMYLPRPQLKSGEELQIKEDMMNNRDAFYAVVLNAKVVDLETYIRSIKRFGYTINDRSNIHAEASNPEGYKVFIMYDDGLGLEVSCMAPIAGAADTGEKPNTEQPSEAHTQGWYDYGIGMLLPKPVLKSGEEPQISSDTFSNSRAGFYAFITNAEATDLDTYVALMIQFGFDITDRSNIHAEAVNRDGCKVFVMFLDGMGMEITSLSSLPEEYSNNPAEEKSDEVPFEAAMLDESNTADISHEDSGIMVLDIPWSGSYVDYCTALLNLGFVDEFHYQFFADSPLDYASIYLGDEEILSAFAPRAETTYRYESKGLAGQCITTPAKKYGGLICREFDLYCYYGVDEAGRVNDQESHTYAATIDFDTNQNGDDLLNKLTMKYGEPQLQEGDNLRAYLWSKEKTRLVYYTNAQGIAYSLWFINPEDSDALRERIRNYVGPDIEDAGI